MRYYRIGIGPVIRTDVARGRGRRRGIWRGRGIGVRVPDYHWIVVGATTDCQLQHSLHTHTHPIHVLLGVVCSFIQCILLVISW